MTHSIIKQILLVEDEAILAMTEKMQLEKYGYAVRTVTTGEKAVAAVGEFSDIDLILMDINLGDGIDGTQAAAIILKDHDIPIVFLSSHTEPEIVEKTEKITSYGYVVKNSNITVLDASIKMAFKLFDSKQILNEKEEVLLYKHEFMSYVIEHNRSAIAVHDKNLNYLYVSQQYLESYRINKQDIIGKHHYEVFPDLPKKWREVHQQALKGEISRAENDPFEREDGTTDWTRWECRPWYEQDGTIGGIIIYTEVITEQKKAETELAESVKLLSRAQEIAHIGIWHLDMTTNRLWWSDEIYRIFGCEPQQFAPTYEAFLNFVHPDDRTAVDDAYTRSVREGNNGYEIEHRIIRRNTDDVRYVHERCDHERDEAGTIIRSIGMVQDITERKRMETTLQNSEKALKDIFESLLAGFWDWNLVDNTEYLSPTFKKMFGYEDYEMESSPEAWQKIAVQEDLPAVFKKFERHVRSHGQIPFYNELRYHHRDGSIVWVICAGRIVEWANDGTPMRVVGCHIDITERKRTEDALYEAERFFKSTLDALSPHIVVLNDLGEIVLTNKAYREFSTYNNTVWTAVSEGVNYLEVCDNAEGEHSQEAGLFADGIRDVLLGKRPSFEMEYPCHSPDELRWFIGRVTPLIDEGSMFVAITHQNITKRKQAEEEIQKQLSEKEVLLREVHHRVKNNIATIEGLLSLQADSTAHAEVKAVLQDAISRVLSMQVLYDKLLLSKNLHEVSMKDYAEDLIDSLAMVFYPASNRTIEKHISEFVIDPKKVFSVGIIINELLTNVFKYAFRDRENGSVSVSIDKEENKVTLIIKDDGKGFDERALKNESPGFGFTVIKMLVEQLGGTYSLSNDNGAKSVIQFVL